MSVLNSAPIIDGERTERLGGPGDDLTERFGGTGSAAEARHLRATRDTLHEIIRGRTEAAANLAALVSRAVLTPEATTTGLRWELRAPADERLGVRALLAWTAVTEQLPGRLRPCANDECNLFLVDHSRPGAAKWCSMASCGNRMKARAHAARRR
ncbi:CGNR zinc finger domain-containing protein [Actinotalea sp. K2]|uniref:CGNR zinc finger domain-containing protein n=1 Tax=Actinotalea sp. K2 TaxID=2939438 RepID=UPI002017EBF3|nr:CGNR zinc finger domain-containing protein [Actinotalea sp. K2]MCL3863287.1 CGNR zinc finger domain-containing protein [Actinotalea sp. K2]